MNWQSLIKDFKNFLKFEKNLTENTIQSYVLDIKKLIDFIEDSYINKKADDITNNDIKQFIYTQSKIIGTRSQSRLISSIKKFFHFLEIEKLIEENPTDELEYPKIGLKIPETLTTIEIDSLINYFKNSKNNSLRNSTITEVLYSCGVRVSELINIKISDIFFEDFLIKVNGKGNKERFVPMSKLSKIMIKDYISSERFNIIPKKGYQDFLFLNNRGQSLTRVMIYTILNIAKKGLGFKKKISPHLLRHSFATHLIENGADISSIQKMLGHTNITTTERYLHVSKKHLIETIKKYHPKNI
ncbi:MAG: tyrosine recombinase XerD [Cryomorphaceae bacterium MED-G14]|nr:MAG: tyrosine recombinase XerD [Cryomorphaceae bacterium MED-G14]|tara:strand:- start:244 stop:1143 length:900 start_codon:yes stop_codon:yes gene_type:complete